MHAEIGKILEGKVTGITKFGAFVDIGEDKNGMVHISEISSAYVINVNDYLQEGQNIKVKVINITNDGKISLSIRQAEEQNEKRKFLTKVPENNIKESPKNFEDMLAKFKQVSNERMSDLKKLTESKRGVGVPKRGARSNRQR